MATLRGKMVIGRKEVGIVEEAKEVVQIYLGDMGNKNIFEIYKKEIF